MSVPNYVFATPNSQYAVLAWEPILFSGERINVAAIAQFNKRPFVKTLIRGDVLRCMYGSAAEGIIVMLSTILDGLYSCIQEEGWEEAIQAVPVQNFTLSPAELTYASSEEDLFRQIVLSHCSLSVLADEGNSNSEESPAIEREVNQKWTTQIRNAIQLKRPELSMYFNGEAVLIKNGLPVKFALLSPKLAAHFGLLRISAQAAGMKEARAKMWELALAKEINGQIDAALIFGTPSYEDITISDRQRDHLKANMHELTCEALTKSISLRPVQTVEAAAAAVIELAY